MILSNLRASAWKYGAYLLAVLLVGASILAGIQSYRLQVAKGATAILARDWAEERLANANAQTEASEAARAAEQARAGAVNAADVAYQRGLQDGKAAADNVLAGVADGTYVLRNKFRCPARAAAETPASPGVGDGRAPAVLSDADVQFLVRFAHEADDAVRQLTACQAVIAADRALP